LLLFKPAAKKLFLCRKNIGRPMTKQYGKKSDAHYTGIFFTWIFPNRNCGNNKQHLAACWKM